MSKPTELPLPPWEIEPDRAARHDAEAPEYPQPPEPELLVVEKDDRRGPNPDVPPSMPSYQRELTPVPQLLPIARRRRLLLRGMELEPLHIFPPEGRWTYVDRAAPWVCASQVASGANYGSGVLIGPRHVLTASHVIDWGPILFMPGFMMPPVQVSLTQGGVTLASAFAIAVMTYEHISDVTYTNADDDYSVIVLDTRLGDTYGYLGARTYDSGWDNETANWCNIAYAPDISASTPVFQRDFFLDEDDFDLGGGRMLITKTGDFVHGMSGSPVFGFWSDGPYVVGVTSAASEGGSGKYNAIAGGNNLTRLVNKARADFP